MNVTAASLWSVWLEFPAVGAADREWWCAKGGGLPFLPCFTLGIAEIGKHSSAVFRS